ncbi:MAG: hypothetical protein QME77_13530, partial [bacterium]|nr:hypothetical protein [bacterium]
MSGRVTEMPAILPDAGGKGYDREYDTRGNLIWEREHMSWLDTTYRYDQACDRPVHRSQSLGGQAPFAEDRWEYDSADRVIREVRTGAGGVREETRRTYDALGRLVFVE